VEYIESRRD